MAGLPRPTGCDFESGERVGPRDQAFKGELSRVAFSTLRKAGRRLTEGASPASSRRVGSAAMRSIMKLEVALDLGEVGSGLIE